MWDVRLNLYTEEKAQITIGWYYAHSTCLCKKPQNLPIPGLFIIYSKVSTQ